MVESSLKDYFKSFEDDRGSLMPIEFKNIGFQPKRIFVVNNVPLGEIRGEHSHYVTQQYLICINGKVKVYLDNGYGVETITLLKNEGVLIPPLVWDSQEFLTKDASILVVCSTEYDKDDYILDYDSFIREIKNR